ncbi:conserved protein of unknown function [Cyanobium sp. NIES-981]|nr:conserved protein of unknown function [Cyanobium sp. NIES-981]
MTAMDDLRSTARFAPGRIGTLLALGGNFLAWFGESLIHAMGNPEQERRLQPPLVGVQPYCDRPYRAAR